MAEIFILTGTALLCYVFWLAGREYGKAEVQTHSLALAYDEGRDEGLALGIESGIEIGKLCSEIRTEVVNIGNIAQRVLDSLAAEDLIKETGGGVE